MTHTVFTSQSFPEILGKEGLITRGFHAPDKQLSQTLPTPLLSISFILFSFNINKSWYWPNLKAPKIPEKKTLNYLEVVFALWYGTNDVIYVCQWSGFKEFYLQQLSLNHKTIHLYQLCSSRLHFKATRLFDNKD